MSTRAKFKCNHVTNFGEYENASLHAVYAGDKNEEDNQFSKATPSGSLEITISNPAAIGFFKPGKDYYLDISEVPAE